MDRTLINEILAAEETGKRVTVKGWVRTRRDSKGGFSFIELNDGSCLANLQIIADQKLLNYQNEVTKLQTGCSIRVLGSLSASQGKAQAVELHAEEIEVLGWADPELYPLQKKRHSFEFLRTIAHLRPRTNTFGSMARIRNTVCWAIHSFFQERGFVYIHTPIITGNDCEGAGDLFHVTSFDLDNVPCKQSKVDFQQDFFNRPAYLTVSGQLEAETHALALGNVYTFGPTFRAENSNTSRHLAEFWMVEPEMAFCDLDGNMKLAEDFLKTISQQVLDKCRDDLDLFNRFIDKTVLKTLEDIVSKDFMSLPYSEAVEILTKADETFEFPVGWGEDLQSEHERYLCEKVFQKPIIMINYPKEIKPFYMKSNDDGKTVRAMDVLVPRVGEIIGGSQREDDYDLLLKAMEDKGIDPEEYWWYLDLRRYGSVPHSGFGLGLERLLQFITGMQNIRDVIPFPRTPGNVSF